MPAAVTYPLASTGSQAASSATAAQGVSLGQGLEFLGFGLLTPFGRGASDFHNGGGLAHLQSMIGQVLVTMAGSDFTEGELPWRSDFGSLLHFLRHKQNTEVTAELARVYVGEALAKWIPQVILKDVRTEKREGTDGEENVLEIRLTYDVISINQPGNPVLAQSISQTIPVPS
jgi:Bacteriophage baseplate protein W